MSKNNTDKNSENIFNFLKKSYDETIDLVVFSRDYFESQGRIDKQNLQGEEKIVYTLAMSTITTQLTSVLGWLLMCRAVQEGEIAIDELKSEDLRMPEFDIGVTNQDSCFANLNNTIKTMLDKSNSLYNRMKRMEKSICEQVLKDGD